MKRILLSILLMSQFFLADAKNSNCTSIIKTDTLPTVQLVTFLSQMNVESYYGKPVDSLLAHLPSGYISMKIGGWRSQRLAEVLYIIYPNKVSVGIHVRNFQFINPHLVNTSNPTQNWDITLFKKEAITFTVIFNGPLCINGCENEYK